MNRLNCLVHPFVLTSPRVGSSTFDDLNDAALAAEITLVGREGVEPSQRVCATVLQTAWTSQCPSGPYCTNSEKWFERLDSNQRPPPPNAECFRYTTLSYYTPSPLIAYDKYNMVHNGCQRFIINAEGSTQHD